MDLTSQPKALSDATHDEELVKPGCETSPEQVPDQSTQSKTVTNIVDLPTEIVEQIAEHLAVIEIERRNTEKKRRHKINEPWTYGEDSLLNLRLCNAKLAAKIERVISKKYFERIWVNPVEPSFHQVTDISFRDILPLCVKSLSLALWDLRNTENIDLEDVIRRLVTTLPRFTKLNKLNLLDFDWLSREMRKGFQFPQLTSLEVTFGAWECEYFVDILGSHPLLTTMGIRLCSLRGC
jgi:hypothetical protein